MNCVKIETTTVLWPKKKLKRVCVDHQVEYKYAIHHVENNRFRFDQSVDCLDFGGILQYSREFFIGKRLASAIRRETMGDEETRRAAIMFERAEIWKA